MKKIHHLILIVIGVATLLGSGGWLWHSRYAEKQLNCVGNVEWNIGSNRFAGTVSFRMYKDAGLATITGKLYGRNTSDISRNIYFSYTRQHEARVLQAMQVVKTFADSADEADINNTLPGFYRQSGRNLSLVMEEYKGAWIFASSNAPSLYCRKR
ncbi:hypothetical protein [Citrobacter sp. Cb223]|uniref:hypothetical protein n=1 Tax=Citrobacter sp. Cb223 TaxID=2985035 RepID=UPI002577D066|nr:hypothetical protein [Citrobacter sp. Cb223]MDM3308268.1 hypothetical protein [Citrobacter sp. Cb223]